ncbi:MAG: hypothetical protein WCB79_09940, partial [Halobacteriota archaeon]
MQSISLFGEQLNLYLKEEIGNGYCLLLSALAEEPYLLVDLGFKIPPAVIDDISSAVPLDVLRDLALTFGLTIRIGPEANKFIIQRTIPLPETLEPTEIVEIINPKSHSFAQSVIVRPNYDLKTVDCALAFCIDLDSYCDWLESLPQMGPLVSAEGGIELPIWHLELLR